MSFALDTPKRRMISVAEVFRSQTQSLNRLLAFTRKAGTFCDDGRKKRWNLCYHWWDEWEKMFTQKFPCWISVSFSSGGRGKTTKLEQVGKKWVKWRESFHHSQPVILILKRVLLTVRPTRREAFFFRAESSQIHKKGRSRLFHFSQIELFLAWFLHWDCQLELYSSALSGLI